MNFVKKKDYEQKIANRPKTNLIRRTLLLPQTETNEIAIGH